MTIPRLDVTAYDCWRPEKYSFENRQHAGELLGKKLIESYRDRLKNPLFIGCVRGGLAVAKGVADYMRLNGVSCDLDLVIIRKLSLPTDKEMGIGAMGEDGSPWFLDDLVKKYAVDTSSPIMLQQIEDEKAELARRQALYRRERVILSDRTIVIVDEGLSSGATMIAAVKTIQNMCQGADIMVAVPVASRFGLGRLTNLAQIKEADLCVLEIPYTHGKIWNTTDFYNKDNHRKATDVEVLEILSSL